MAKGPKKFKKINPNEFGGLLFNTEKAKLVSRILNKGKIFRYSSRLPSLVDDLEQLVCKTIDCENALGLNNGTSALKTALIALGINKGDRVLISSFTFMATAAAVVSVGAIPIPIDFDFSTGMDLKDLEREINKGCAVIIPVHLQGRCFDLTEIIKLAKRKHIPVIEDACQAFGARHKNKYSGTFGDIGVFSFQQYKQISCGEGGMLVTNNKKYFDRAKIYSDHGIVRETMSWESDESMLGDNLRMNNIQAAILLPQVKGWNNLFKIQHRLSSIVLNKLKKEALNCIVTNTDKEGDTGMNIFFLAPSDEDAIQIIAHAKTKNIEIRRLWDKPYYMHAIIGRLKLTPGDLDKSDCVRAKDISRRLISLSITPTLSPSQTQKIINEINYSVDQGWLK